MRLRIVTFVLVGVLIAGAVTAPLVNSECELCGGTGKLECSVCLGTGMAPHFFFVECACGEDPSCPICYGVGFYPSMTAKPCEECDGKGWIPCPACGGDGKKSLLERFSELWRAKHQE